MVPSSDDEGLEELTPEEHDALRLAAKALNAAVAEDWDHVESVVNLLHDEHGVEGLVLAMLGWCDVLISQTPQAQGGQVNLAFIQQDTGHIGFADSVPAEVAWAGQVLAARAAKDKDMWDALMEVIPEDGAKAGIYIGALLDVVALNLRVGGGSGFLVSSN